MERWACIPGYDGRYEVSDQGRVRTCAHEIWVQSPQGDHVRRYRAKDRKLQVDADGYMRVTLHRDGRGRPIHVGRLVLEAFDRSPEPGEHACHLNHERADNRLENLSWGTQLENERQKTSAARRPRPYNKLPDNIRLAIRRSIGHASLSQIARNTGCHVSTVWKIKQEKA